MRRRVETYLPASEHAELKRRARAAGVSMSLYLLRASLEPASVGAVLASEAEEFAGELVSLVDSLQPVAAKLNEAARFANAHQELREDTLHLAGQASRHSADAKRLLRRYVLDPAEEHEVDFYEDAAVPERGLVAKATQRAKGSAPLKSVAVLVSEDERWKLETRAKAKRKTISRLLREDALSEQGEALVPALALQVSRQASRARAQLSGYAVNIQQMLRHTSDTATTAELRAVADTISLVTAEIWELMERLAQ